MNECVHSLVAIYDYSEEVDDDDVDDYMAKNDSRVYYDDWTKGGTRRINL